MSRIHNVEHTTSPHNLTTIRCRCSQSGYVGFRNISSGYDDLGQGGVSAANRLRQLTHAGGPETAVAKVDLLKHTQDAAESGEAGHVKVDVLPFAPILGRSGQRALGQIDHLD